MRIRGLGVSRYILAAIIVCALCGPGLCGSAGAQEVLRLRVATAVSGSGIMDLLRPIFTEQTGIVLRTSVAGSGRSLRDGMLGAVDVLLVNAPDAEAAFVASGAGAQRRPVMSGRYILVGPPDDPAGVAGAASAREAFERISGTQSMFVSRADDSGGHQREMAIWRMVGVEPYGDWYYEVGLGVRRTLAIAEERHAYMLLDEATWLKYGDQAALALLLRGDPVLDDQYSVITINPSLDAAINAGHAEKFLSWITAKPAQALIAAYEVNGVRPFTAAPDGAADGAGD